VCRSGVRVGGKGRDVYLELDRVRGGLDLAPVFLESGFWNQAVVVVVDGVGVSEFVFDRVRMPRLLCRRRALWKPSM